MYIILLTLTPNPNWRLPNDRLQAKHQENRARRLAHGPLGGGHGKEGVEELSCSCTGIGYADVAGYVAADHAATGKPPEYGTMFVELCSNSKLERIFLTSNFFSNFFHNVSKIISENFNNFSCENSGTFRDHLGDFDLFRKKCWNSGFSIKIADFFNKHCKT